MSLCKKHNIWGLNKRGQSGRPFLHYRFMLIGCLFLELSPVTIKTDKPEPKRMMVTGFIACLT